VAFETLIREHDGVFSVMLASCTCAVLERVLDPAVPIVWIRRHFPQPILQWWRTQIPISPGGGPHELEVRSVELEIQLPTARFLQILPEFAQNGIDLCQMDRRVPDSLTMHDISDRAFYRVLVQNGLRLHFYLPHAVEDAFLSSPDRARLESALRHADIADIAFNSLTRRCRHVVRSS